MKVLQNNRKNNKFGKIWRNTVKFTYRKTGVEVRLHDNASLYNPLDDFESVYVDIIPKNTDVVCHYFCIGNETF